jgi:hypothetical protein
MLQLQRDLPLSEFMQESGRFQSAPRAGQFAQAEGLIPAGQHIAASVPASRQALNYTPTQTTAGVNTAGQAVGMAGRVDPRFNQLRGIGADRAAIERANQVANIVRQVPGTFAEVRNQANPAIADLIGMSDRQITGANIQQDPAYQAAIQAFESAIMPTIQNQAALSGLGRSTGLTQSLAAGQAQYLLPVIQETLAREERGLERGLGARQFGITTQADLGLQEAMARERGLERYGQAGLAAANFEDTRIGRELEATLQSALAGERGTQRQQQAMQFLSGQQMTAGQQDYQRALEGLYADERSRALQYQANQDAANRYTQLGQLEQDYTQAALDRQTQEYMRRQALAEQALYTPFGQTGSTVGQQASTSGGKK